MCRYLVIMTEFDPYSVLYSPLPSRVILSSSFYESSPSQRVHNIVGDFNFETEPKSAEGSSGSYIRP